MTTPIRVLSVSVVLCCGSGSLASAVEDGQQQHESSSDFLQHTRVSEETSGRSGRPRFPSSSSAAAAVLGARPGKPLFPWHLESFKRSKEESGTSTLEEHDDDDDYEEFDDDDDGHVVGYSAAELGREMKPIMDYENVGKRFDELMRRAYKLPTKLINKLKRDTPVCDLDSFRMLEDMAELYQSPEQTFGGRENSMLELDEVRYLQEEDDGAEYYDDEEHLLGEGGGSHGDAEASTLEAELEAGFMRSPTETERKRSERKKLRRNKRTTSEQAGYDDNEEDASQLTGDNDDDVGALKRLEQTGDIDDGLGKKNIWTKPQISCREANEQEIKAMDALGGDDGDDEDDDEDGNSVQKTHELSKKARAAKAKVEGLKARQRKRKTIDEGEADDSETLSEDRAATRSAKNRRRAANDESGALEFDANGEEEFDEDWDEFHDGPESSELELVSGAELSLNSIGEVTEDSTSVLEAGSEVGLDASLAKPKVDVEQHVCSWEQGDKDRFQFTVFVVKEIPGQEIEDGLGPVSLFARLLEGKDLHEHQMAPRHHFGKDKAHFGMCRGVVDQPWNNAECGKAWNLDIEQRRFEANFRAGKMQNLKWFLSLGQDTSDYGGMSGQAKSVQNELDEMWRFRFVDIVYDDKGTVTNDGLSKKTEFGTLDDGKTVMKPFSWLQVGPGQKLPCIVRKGREETFLPKLGKRNHLSSPDYKYVTPALNHHFHHPAKTGRKHGWMYPDLGWNPFNNARDFKCSFKKMKNIKNPAGQGGAKNKLKTIGRSSKARCRVWEWNGKKGKTEEKKKKKKKKEKKEKEEPETEVSAPTGPTTQEKPGSSCLAQSSLLHTPQGLVEAGSLQIGDFLVGPGGVPEPIIAMLHHHVDAADDAAAVAPTEFTSVTVSDSLAPIRVSADHIIFLADGRAVPASTLEIGDKLANRAGTGSSVVTGLGSVIEQGFLAPLTPSGIIFSQDGAILSCYAGEDMPHALAHAVLSPLRATYTIFPFAAQGYLAHANANSTEVFAPHLISH